MNRHKEETNFFRQDVIDEKAMLAYINNELKAEDRQQFEKLLVEDPFAQDALEGLQASQQKAAITHSISSINKKIRERTGLKEKEPLQIHWANYAWAAALLGLLIGIGVVMVNFIGKNDSNIAMNKEDAAKSEGAELFEAPQQEIKSAETSALLTADSAQQVLSAKMDTPRLESYKGEQSLVQTKAAAQIQKKQVEVNGNKKDDATASSVPPTAVAESKIEAAKQKEGTLGTGAAKSDDKPNSFEKSKEEAGNSVVVSSTQKVMRGSIMEREENDKVTVVSVDDAMKNFNSGDYKQSADQFDVILQQHPNNADALYFGGISDYINGNSRKSEKNFDKLLKEGTKFIEGSKWYKANILLQKDKREEAKKLLDELSQSNGSYKERAIKKKTDAGL